MNQGERLSNTDSSVGKTSGPTWYVYMVETATSRLYTGITTDPERRLGQHQTGKGGAKYFRSNPAVRIVYLESVPDRSTASQREHAVKKLTRPEKLALIKRSGPPAVRPGASTP